MSQPKTIITYLVDWNPTGIKTVELSNWIGKAIVIPRSKLKESKDRLETKQPAIYFLFGEDENWIKQAYIWEAENLIARLSNHDTNKDFWDTVVAFVSKDNNLTKADVKFLEANAIKKWLEVKRFELLNSVEPIPNNLPEYQISTMNEFLENIDILISAIGYPILKTHIVDKKFDLNRKTYFIKTKWCTASGLYNEDWFLVFAGSEWPVEMTTSQTWWQWYAFRHRPLLLQKWVIVYKDNKIIFTQDYQFTSPSSAADFITGRYVNGWITWKDKDGKTLDENERKSLSG